MIYARYISMIAIIVGLPLMCAPWWWPEIIGGARAWTNAQAAEYSQAAANLHHLSHDSAQRRTDEAGAITARYYQQRDALQQARHAGQTAAAVMQCLGMLAVFTGLLACSVMREEPTPV